MSERQSAGTRHDASTWRLVGAFEEERRTWLAILPVALAVGAFLLFRSRGFFHDDGHITLRYVANWLDGHGLVWNPGERVEGFTHPLWLLQVTGLGALGFDLVVAARLLGYAYFAALVAVWVPARAASLFVLPLVTFYGFTLWTGGGLEIAGFSFWLVLAAWQTTVTRDNVDGDAAATRPAVVAGLALAAAALMRPEGTGVAMLAILWVALARKWRPTIAMAISFLVPMTAYLSFRLIYYGDYLPNSARAKIDGLPVWEQLSLAMAYLVRVRGEWLPVMAVIVVCLVLARSRRAWVIATLSLPVWGGLALGGGDHMIGARLATPAIVLCLYGAAVGVRERVQTRALPRWLAPTLIALSVWQAIPMAVNPPAFDSAATNGRTTGRALAQVLPPDTLVAAATAGTVPYYSRELRFVDTLGLNDAVIARRKVPLGVTRWQRVPGHKKGDGRYVLDRRPDVIILGGAQGWLGESLRWWFLGDYELLLDPEFYREYTPHEIKILLYSPKHEKSFPTHMYVHLRNDSSKVRRLREIGIERHHPFDGPPDPSSFPLDSLPPEIRPEPVPLLRPLHAIRDALAPRPELSEPA
jgi:arabinofuranosyltransferase